MRIVHVYKDYYPILGGIENHVRVLAEHQAAAGHQVSVVVCAVDHSSSQRVENGVTVVRVGRLGTLRSMPVSLGFARALKGAPADVVHIHSPFPLGEQAALRLSAQTPLVVTHHADVVKQRILLKFYAPLYRRFLRRVNRIVVTSANYARSSPWLVAHKEKCCVVPLGIDLDVFSPAQEETPPTYDLLFAGKLRYYKGLDDLLHALHSLEGITLAIVGDGQLRGQLEAQAVALGLAQRVAFLGEVSDDELPRLYRSARIFVLPANCRAEAFGTVLIEAMAAGLPCVTTELQTGTSWVVQDGITGSVVAPGNSGELAATIRKLLGNPTLCRQFGAAGRQRAAQHFATSQMLAGIEAVYADVLKDVP